MVDNGVHQGMNMDLPRHIVTVWLRGTLILLTTAFAAGEEGVLFDSQTPNPMARVVSTPAKVEPGKGGGILARIPYSRTGRFLFKLGEDPTLDLSRRTRLEVTVRAVGPNPAMVNLLVLDAKGNSVSSSRGISPNTTVTTRIVFRRAPPAGLPMELKGFKSQLPGGFGTTNLAWNFVDPSKLAHLAIQAVAEAGAEVELVSIRVAGDYQEPLWTKSLNGDTFFPFVDRWGQFRHAAWPEKILSDEDLLRRTAAEEKALQANPRPRDWSRFGGWLGGKRGEASGSFRVGKVDGRFTLIDPDGYPFFSTGLTTITPRFAASPVTDREKYFDLPPSGDPASRFLVKNNFRAWAGMYANRDYQQYVFSEANLFRKYGNDYNTINVEVVHRRLAAWGMNSMGAWAEESLVRMDKTPYFFMLAPDLPKLSAVAKLVDVHHPDFESRFAAYAQSLQWLRKDPWCVGVFFNNEIHWGETPEKTVMAILKSPEDQPWRRHLEEIIQKENLAGNWVVLGDRVYQEYYETLFRLIKKYLPEKLFVGHREAWGWADNPRSRYYSFKNCDVFSANIYQEDVAWLAPPEGVEKPILIGEFHFGASDTGLGAAVGCETQADRARCYRTYVNSALDNPWVVGVHWFQYGDQPVSGRFDGEAVNTGFVSVGDIPYEALVNAAREVGDTMYVRRSQAPRL